MCYTGQSSGVRWIAISKDKRYIVSRYWNSSVCAWNATNGRQVGGDLYGHEGSVHAVAISHDCRWFVTGPDDKTLRLWELPSGKATGPPLVGHTDLVTCIMISSNDRFVVSGSGDRTVRVWDVRSGKTILGPLEHDWLVKYVCLSRDNQQIILVDWDGGKACLWSVSTGELLKSATDGPSCARLLCKWRNGWNSGEDAGVDSNHKKPRIAVLSPDICICSPTKDRDSFEKVGKFDDTIKGWDVDANGILRVSLRCRNLARLTMITESSNTLQSFENESAI